MTEKLVRVETIRSHKMCNCGGEFKYNNDNAITDIFGSFFSSTATKFLHKCDKCGAEETFDVMYPKTVELEIPVELRKTKDGIIYSVTKYGDNN